MSESTIDPGAVAPVRLERGLEELYPAGAVDDRGKVEQPGRQRDAVAAGLDRDGELGVEARPGVDPALRVAARHAAEARPRGVHSGARAAGDQPRRLAERPQP